MAKKVKEIGKKKMKYRTENYFFKNPKCFKYIYVFTVTFNSVFLQCVSYETPANTTYKKKYKQLSSKKDASRVKVIKLKKSIKKSRRRKICNYRAKKVQK